MMVVGFLFYAKRIEIFSFASLLSVVLLILGFVPAFVFSIGFWLSVAGVYFIYLFLHYWGKWEGWKVYVGLTFWIYVIMLPIIHTLFPLFSQLQLTSPFTSRAYDLFYPLSVVLHMVGWGGVMDDALSSFLSISASGRTLQTPLWFFYLYVVTALLSWREEIAFWLLNALGVLFFMLGVVGI
jgi:competence protein ComEC